MDQIKQLIEGIRDYYRRPGLSEEEVDKQTTKLFLYIFGKTLLQFEPNSDVMAQIKILDNKSSSYKNDAQELFNKATKDITKNPNFPKTLLDNLDLYFQEQEEKLPSQDR